MAVWTTSAHILHYYESFVKIYRLEKMVYRKMHLCAYLEYIKHYYKLYMYHLDMPEFRLP